MQRKTPIKVLGAVLGLLSVLFLGIPHAIGDHGFSSPECLANSQYVQARPSGVNPHESGVEAYAFAEAEWILEGNENVSDGPNYGASYAHANALVVRDFPHAWAWWNFGYSRVWNNGSLQPESERDCGWTLVPSPGWLDRFEQLPQWVQEQVREVGCAAEGDGMYAFRGSVHYDTASQVVYLKQKDNAVNLTATPLLTKSAHIVTMLPESLTITNIEITAYGNDDWGCRAELRV